MSNASGIFKLIILVSVISSLFLIFIDGTRIKERVRFLSGVIILSLILQMHSPLLSELEKLVNLFPSDEEIVTPSEDISKENILKESARQMAVYIKELVCGKFELPSEDVNVSVSLEIENDAVKVKGITLSLTETHLALSSEISKYVSSMMGTVCTVIEL